MNNKFVKNLLSSGMQAIATQILGSIFFYVVSLYLTKNDFGVVNWANAVSVFITSLLGLGLEQVVIRRIAASDRSDWAATAYLFHAIAGSILSFAILFLVSWYPGAGASLNYLPWFFAAQAVIYIAAPLRAFLNAKERFAPYGVIALVSNLAKLVLALLYWHMGALTVGNTAKILIICASFECMALMLYVKRYTFFLVRFKLSAYFKLIRESIPQYFSVIFDSSLSRIDWILLGLLATNEMTANYSFAYRGYEIARLPLMILAPVILPRFSRLMVNNEMNRDVQKKINHFFSIEMFIAILIPLILNIIWSPAVSAITNNKYGYSNAWPFFILSICIPFQFAINLLWTISFANKNYRSVRNITIMTATANLVINLLLIPLYGEIGAAIAYLVSNLVQATSYYIVVKRTVMKLILTSFMMLFVIAGVSYVLSFMSTNILSLRLAIAIGIYGMLSVLFKLVNKETLQVLKLYLTK